MTLPIAPTGAASKSERNDIAVVYEAVKYCRILITNDGGSNKQPGGILGNRETLAEAVAITILSDVEAEQFIRSEVQKRDDYNRLVAQETGQALQEWAGKD